MRNDRSAVARHSHPILVLAAAAAFALAPPGAARGQEVAPDEGVPEGEVILIVLTPAPPPVRGWEEPPQIEVVGLEGAREVRVYSPAPEPMPGRMKLRGVDIEYHRIAQPPEPSRIRTHFGPSDAPTRIAHHDWRSADPTRIPYAGSGSALVSQSWNPSGARYEPSRIRYHGWSRGRGGER
jgi:hypothetical protein